MPLAEPGLAPELEVVAWLWPPLRSLSLSLSAAPDMVEATVEPARTVLWVLYLDDEAVVEAPEVVEAVALEATEAPPEDADAPELNKKD